MKRLLQNLAGGSFCMLAAAAAMFCAPEAGAVPANRKPFTFVQPDGTELTLSKVGDERGHFTVDKSNRLVCYTPDRGYVYAEIDDKGAVVPTDIVAQPGMATRAADLSRFDANTLIPMAMELREGKNRVSDVNRKAMATRSNVDCKDPDFRMVFTDFPSKGQTRGLVILAEFSDKKFSGDNPKEYFTNLLNKQGFNEGGCIGSARDYFIESSKGQYLPDFDVYGPVNVGKPYSYYGENTIYGDDKHAEDLIVDACKLLDDQIDFSDYDYDNDGRVDMVYVFYAGYGEADNPETSTYLNTIWPHTYDLFKYANITCRLDGKLIDHYACSNELRGLYSDMPSTRVGIGTFCHEFSHVLGIPDLYTTTYNSSYTPYEWTLLDQGSYNADGCVPPVYSSFERFSLGWIKPRPFGATKQYTIPNLADTNQAYIIYTDNPTEFFLLENRQQTGWDEHIPGHGMLAWHIDFNQNIWDMNTVNNTISHQYVDLVEANGITTFPYKGQYIDYNALARQHRGAPFPGTSNVTEFNATRAPKLISWNNKPTIISLADIEEDDNGNIVANVTNTENPTEDDPYAGVESIADEGVAGVWSSNGYIYTNATSAIVYDAMGRICGRLSADKPVAVGAGIYVVNANGRSSKVMVR